MDLHWDEVVSEILKKDRQIDQRSNRKMNKKDYNWLLGQSGVQKQA